MSDEPTGLHQAGTWRSDTGQIRGMDGEWYDVPAPVLQRYLVGLGIVTVESTARYSWTQPICDDCWSERRLAATGGRAERCVFCDTATRNGIYIHVDPNSDEAAFPSLRIRS